MRHPKNPKPPPDGWEWLYALAKDLGITRTALAVQARNAGDETRYSRFGAGPSAAWLVSVAEAARLREVYKAKGTRGA